MAFHRPDSGSERRSKEDKKNLINTPYSQEIEVKGHLIDSMILSRIFDRIMDLQGEFEVLEFRIGRRKYEPSYARLVVIAKSEEHLDRLLREVYREGATPIKVGEVRYEPAPKDGVLPDDFYTTTNHPTFIYLDGRWVEVEELMMDKAIVVLPEEGRAICKPINEIKKGDLVVVGEEGIRISPPERPRGGLRIFSFMSGEASSERPTTAVALEVARDLKEIKAKGGKVGIVAGPAVVHTGAAPALAEMVRMGYVDVLLTGNALVVHDVEYALFGTSLGMSLENGTTTATSHRNHMVAINEILKAGSIEELVRQGRLRSGIMYECIKRGVQVAIAGSIRDDGPVPETITDVVEAQRVYRQLLKGVEMVIMLSSMLHSIAVGNMIPSTVKVVAVDINPAVVTKLLDRGSTQALGIVSDVGAFLPLLVKYLREA